jgi:hypothetical protein
MDTIVLFFKWLERLEYERTHRYTPSYPYRTPIPRSTPHQERINFDDDEIEGVIYFYEWSNVTATPRTFYTLKAFKDFMDRSNIYVPSYQWEIIRNIHNPYVACKKNCKELIIKFNWDELKNSLEEGSSDKANSFRSSSNSSHVSKPMDGEHEEQEPYSIAITHAPIRKPPMYEEIDNRYPEMEEVAGWWG